MVEMPEQVLLGYGSGGILSQTLINEIFQPAFSNDILNQMLDAAVFSINGTKMAFTTDSFVVNPIFFPGGDIGKLAVCGTVNDLAVSGAKPCYMSAGMIIEEGLAMADLRRIVHSMAVTARGSGVRIITGDTKVVEKGAVDKIFINTAAIGVIREDLHLHPKRIKAGDAVIVSGTLGEHGLVIKARRQDFTLNTPIESDCASLALLTEVMLRHGNQVRCMRDVTRGGLATILNELAEQSGFSIMIEEQGLPVRSAVKGACSLLGLDPLYLANEGKLVAIVASDKAAEIVADMKNVREGQNACIIGRIMQTTERIVLLKTFLGAQRIVPMLAWDQLPRIC